MGSAREGPNRFGVDISFRSTSCAPGPYIGGPKRLTLKAREITQAVGLEPARIGPPELDPGALDDSARLSCCLFDVIAACVVVRSGGTCIAEHIKLRGPGHLLDRQLLGIGEAA